MYLYTLVYTLYAFFVGDQLIVRVFVEYGSTFV